MLQNTHEPIEGSGMPCLVVPIGKSAVDQPLFDSGGVYAGERSIAVVTERVDGKNTLKDSVSNNTLLTLNARRLGSGP